MGYRGDVAAVFYAVKKEEFAVVKLWLEGNFPMEEWDSCIRWFDRGMIFECDNVKWYDGIPEVAAFKKCADEFIELFCDYDRVMGESVGAYEFMWVGEGIEDMEHDREGNHGYLLDISRKIEINVNL